MFPLSRWSRYCCSGWRLWHLQCWPAGLLWGRAGTDGCRWCQASRRNGEVSWSRPVNWWPDAWAEVNTAIWPNHNPKMTPPPASSSSPFLQTSNVNHIKELTLPMLVALKLDESSISQKDFVPPASWGWLFNTWNKVSLANGIGCGVSCLYDSKNLGTIKVQFSLQMNPLNQTWLFKNITVL